MIVIKRYLGDINMHSANNSIQLKTFYEKFSLTDCRSCNALFMRQQ